MGIEGKKEYLTSFLCFCEPEQKHRQNKAEFLGSFSPYILLSGVLLYF